MNPIPLELDTQMFLRLLMAVVLGALVGYKRSTTVPRAFGGSPVDERERAGKPAGCGRMAWSASARHYSPSSPFTDLVVQAIQRALQRRS